MHDRPSDMSPGQLRFIPQRSVKWLSPRVLADTAARLGLARALGAYLDKRELLGFYPQDVFDHSQKDELWIDYVADVGDGFNATYSVAHQMSQPELDVDGEPLPRGDILIMGGDEVYPSANWREYENRTKGPYQAANPQEKVDLYAIPGNHDWYDGLTAFSRLFMQKRHIGGYQTKQQRSYFALKLPHDWWLFAIDAEFDAYLDEPQLEYFREAAERMRPGDRVILCVPQPSWVWTELDRRSFDRIDYFIEKIVKPREGTVPLILTGDRHHYARYAEIDGDRQLVTAGGGGAYTSPTHNLPMRLNAPPKESIASVGGESKEYRLEQTYPTRSKSWRYGFGIFHRLPGRNPGFVTFLGLLHLIALVSILQGTGPGVTACAGLLLVATLFAQPVAGGRLIKHWVLGLGHGAAHIGLAFGGTAVWRTFEYSGIFAYIAYVGIAGLAAVWLVGAYLLLANRYGVNANELFAGLSVIDSKCFLRLKVTQESVTVYPIGIPKSSRKWRANPQGAEGTPWIEPTKPIRHELIETPFHVPAPGPKRAEIPAQNRLRTFIGQAFGMDQSREK